MDGVRIGGGGGGGGTRSTNLKPDEEGDARGLGALDFDDRLLDAAGSRYANRFVLGLAV